MTSDAGHAADSFVRISRTSLWATVALLALCAGLLMLAMLNVDLDALLGGEDLAMKVGGTAVTREDFIALKRLSEPKAGSIGDAAFAAELLETLFLAEAGRRLGLDRQKDFQDRVVAFDRAIALASDPVDLSKALFLLEELARRTRDGIIAAADAESATFGDTDAPAVAGETASETAPAKLHLRTILAGGEDAAAAVMAAATGGSAFASLNASWSRSPYAATGGDLGWVGPEDLPPGVYERLEELPVGSITRAFSDGNGVHLFLVEARPAAPPGQGDRLRLGRRRAEHRQRALDRFTQTMRATMPWFVHPSLKP
ncbi:MAG TPA: peptidylprolyl isomerase [Candidatus Ozemobacteraceae bacterium]|nr:peptidylprolyl isomerase [Candidatus Ozemobacteraceae bacterium]